MCQLTLVGLSSIRSAKVVLRCAGDGQVPPDHLALGGFAHARKGSLQGRGVERRDGPWGEQRRVDLDIGAHADNEQARPRLRHEQGGVDDQRAVAIAGVGEGLADRLEVAPAVRRQRSEDIFQGDELRPTAIRDKALHDVPERIERARALALQAGAAAGERKVLAGKGAPDEIGVAGQVVEP